MLLSGQGYLVDRLGRGKMKNSIVNLLIVKKDVPLFFDGLRFLKREA